MEMDHTIEVLKQEEGSQSVDSNPQKAQEIASGIKLELVDTSQFFNFCTIKQILEKSIDLAEEDFVRATLNNRKERRVLLQTDIDGYKRLVFKNNEEADNALRRSEEQILKVLNVTSQDLADSINYASNQGYSQDIYILQSEILQKLKLKRQSKQSLTFDQTKEIYKYQLNLLAEQPQTFQQIMASLSSSSSQPYQDAPIMITCLLNDYTFDKFGIEEEDQMKNLMNPALLQNQEIMDIFREYSLALMNQVTAFGQKGLDNPTTQILVTE